LVEDLKDLLCQLCSHTATLGVKIRLEVLDAISESLKRIYAVIEVLLDCDVMEGSNKPLLESIEGIFEQALQLLISRARSQEAASLIGTALDRFLRRMLSDLLMNSAKSRVLFKCFMKSLVGHTIRLTCIFIFGTKSLALSSETEKPPADIGALELESETLFRLLVLFMEHVSENMFEQRQSDEIIPGRVPLILWKGECNGKENVFSNTAYVQELFLNGLYGSDTGFSDFMKERNKSGPEDGDSDEQLNDRASQDFSTSITGTETGKSQLFVRNIGKLFKLC
jgi:hypothetical protein